MTSPRRDMTPEDFDDHGSLAASLSDFETSEPRASPTFDMPSQHSGFRSRSVARCQESDIISSDSDGPWSPPGWRRQNGGWFQNTDDAPPSPMMGSARSSREGSPSSEDENNDVTLATRIPLPGSPEKRRSPSPSKHAEGERNANEEKALTRLDKEDHQSMDAVVKTPNNNYFRFAVRAEVQHRTEPIDAALTFWRQTTKSKTSMFLFLTTLLFAWAALRNLVQTPDQGPGPDLIKVASLARSFEPLLHYSESGVQQIGELQETGVAVWDLRDSVKQSNLTSAPIIANELDGLSTSLKSLALEMTSFFANVDGDVDNILLVMEWAKRELNHVSQQRPSGVSAAIENLSGLAHSLGGPEVSGYLHTLFGLTHGQQARVALSRTFHEFLGVLEDSIHAELKYSDSLFALFKALDQQFLNVHRATKRETISQEAALDAQMSGLWNRLAGVKASEMRKFERNRDLLESLKSRTLQNKSTLEEHTARLLSLKANLETLRQRLISPLLRSENTSSSSLVDQIEGIEGTLEYLNTARSRQRDSKLKRLYSAGKRGIGQGDNMPTNLIGK
ncbi:MAG: hypothetical protein M1831_005415 [Alyxoria varia]|nr:MAG: hypothetical protein M1831_005415 [Alyxoria varia]